jgi:hypothetical protein
MGNVPNLTTDAGVAITNIDLSSFVTLTNGDAISSYAIASGTLPDGLSLNSST